MIICRAVLFASIYHAHRICFLLFIFSHFFISPALLLHRITCAITSTCVSFINSSSVCCFGTNGLTLGYPNSTDYTIGMLGGTELATRRVRLSDAPNVHVVQLESTKYQTSAANDYRCALLSDHTVR